jgi:hypothetical protein
MELLPPALTRQRGHDARRGITRQQKKLPDAEFFPGRPRSPAPLTTAASHPMMAKGEMAVHSSLMAVPAAFDADQYGRGGVSIKGTRARFS